MPKTRRADLPAQPHNAPDIRIAIAIQGWVFVGRYEAHENHVALSNASVIRQWGTTTGIGELAFKGPLKNTVLDPCGCVDIPRSSLVAAVRCDAAHWKDRI